MFSLVKENANLSKESDTAAENAIKLRMQSLLWFVTAIASL